LLIKRLEQFEFASYCRIVKTKRKKMSIQITTEKNNEGITAPTQKAGLRVPKTIWSGIKH
jgi:hypothetical protein